MLGTLLFSISLVAALLVLAALPKLPGPMKIAGLVISLVILTAGILLGSVKYVGSNEVGIISKNAMGAALSGGKIIAVSGEMGVQADVLPPGWHFGFIPGVYSVRTTELVEIKADEVGLLETSDGEPLDNGQLFAPEFKRDEFQKMLDARYFLTTGKGKKGKQTSVLTPGKYRLNTELFKVRPVKQTEVPAGEVAVLKANFGAPPSQVIRGVAGALEPGLDGTDLPDDKLLKLAKSGEMGVQAMALPPGKYPLNTEAFTVTEVWTTQMIAQFTEGAWGVATANQTGSINAPPTQNYVQSSTKASHDPTLEEHAITVRTSDGFTFPVDVRVEYVIEPQNAPIVVAKLGDDEGARFRNAINSAVRAIFRNNAEGVRALDYVQQRSHQESQSLAALVKQMSRFGVTVTAVRIGNVGDEKSLGALLKTQTDREIAKQEQMTFQEQQKAAEQKKSLARVTQESEEEKKLATAAYSVKIADEAQKQKIVEAKAEAESTKIKAMAQADAYRQIAEQIGKSNAALVEILKIVGEKNIQIAPRVMVTGDHQSGGGTALIGTMLDSMVTKEEPAKPAK
ncbi:MAG: SPFH domain-containing protein [Phycisphaerales bacterium]|nr:hypothetical protein [Planctomycetota bacterium]